MSFDVRTLPRYTRDVPYFPQPGGLPKDITTLLREPVAFRGVVDFFAKHYHDHALDVVAGIESRGFIFGAPLAYVLGVAFVPIRKFGKLPAERVEEAYDLEYGTATIEMHTDSLRPGQRVLLVDDVLATGGTLGAALALVEQLGAVVTAVSVVIELAELGGRQRIAPHAVHALWTT